jgi:hypothetical protein
MQKQSIILTLIIEVMSSPPCLPTAARRLQVEPLSVFKEFHDGMNLHQFQQFGNEQLQAQQQQAQASEQANAPAPEVSTTSSSGQVMPLSLFEQYHDGMNVQQWEQYAQQNGPGGNSSE